MTDNRRDRPIYITNPRSRAMEKPRQAAGMLLVTPPGMHGIKMAGALLLRRSKNETSMHGLWELPGGKVEGGLTPLETALIETREETGLGVQLIVPWADGEQMLTHHDTGKDYHIFIGVPDRLNVVLSDEHDEFEWVPLEHLLRWAWLLADPDRGNNPFIPAFGWAGFGRIKEQKAKGRKCLWHKNAKISHHLEYTLHSQYGPLLEVLGGRIYEAVNGYSSSEE